MGWYPIQGVFLSRAQWAWDWLQTHDWDKVVTNDEQMKNFLFLKTFQDTQEYSCVTDNKKAFFIICDAKLSILCNKIKEKQVMIYQRKSEEIPHAKVKGCLLNILHR